MNMPALLSELSECLVAADGSNPSSQVSEDGSFAAKMQTVLLAFVKDCTKVNRPREKELGSILKLFNLALQRLPDSFTGQDCSAAASMLLLLVPLFANSSIRPIHETLRQSVLTLVELTARRSRTAYLAVLADLFKLITDCRDALQAMSLSAPSLQEESVQITAFEAVQMHIAQAAQQNASQTNAKHPAYPSSSLQIEVSSVQECQLLVSSLVQVVSFAAKLTPFTLQRPLQSGLLSDLLSLLSGGGFTVQTACLEALDRALLILQPDEAESSAILELLSQVILRWYWDGPSEHGLLPLWKQSMLECLGQLAESAPARAWDTLLPLTTAEEGKVSEDWKFRTAVGEVLTAAANSNPVSGPTVAPAELAAVVAQLPKGLACERLVHTAIASVRQQSSPQALELAWAKSNASPSSAL